MKSLINTDLRPLRLGIPWGCDEVKIWMVYKYWGSHWYPVGCLSLAETAKWGETKESTETYTI